MERQSVSREGGDSADEKEGPDTAPLFAHLFIFNKGPATFVSPEEGVDGGEDSVFGVFN